MKIDIINVSISGKIVAFSQSAVHFILPLNRDHTITNNVYLPVNTRLILMAPSLEK
jgi:hypothetical protein